MLIPKRRENRITKLALSNSCCSVSQPAAFLWFITSLISKLITVQYFLVKLDRKSIARLAAFTAFPYPMVLCGGMSRLTVSVCSSTDSHLQDNGVHTPQAAPCVSHFLISAKLLRYDRWEKTGQSNLRSILWSCITCHLWSSSEIWNGFPDLNTFDPHNTPGR